jgi:hypothetical protein
MCLAGEISQSRRTPQPTRAMHESSHNATLRVAKVSRKQAGASLLKCHPPDEIGQVLDDA